MAGWFSPKIGKTLGRIQIDRPELETLFRCKKSCQDFLKSRDLPCVLRENNGDAAAIENCVGLLNFECCSRENWGTELEIGNCFDAKICQDLLKKCKKSCKRSCQRCCKSLNHRQWNFWKTHWVQSVEGNIWSSTAPQKPRCESEEGLIFM